MLCLPSHPKSNTKECKAFPNAFSSLLTATLTALLHLLPTPVLAVVWIFGGLMFLREQCHFFLSLYHGSNGLFLAHQPRVKSVWSLCEEGPCYGFRGQVVLQFAVCWYGTAVQESMSVISVTSLGSSCWKCCMLRVPGKKFKKPSGKYMN